MVWFAPQLELLPRVALTITRAGSDGVALKQVSVLRLRAAIDQVWNDYSYRENAQRLQQARAVAGSA